MSIIAIEFKNIIKHFNIYINKTHSLKEKIINSILKKNKLEVNEYCVLKNASFKILKGETVGIIGENGTGKSTTLKIVSNILTPDSGQMKVNGKVSALLEIGAGFQPDLTGKENVYLYGSILGMKKNEIEKKYDEIVKFSELSNFMDTPVKNYSSGMYMRLAFSVAINVNPDILVIDEVLAVGDENFQKKCLAKILEFKKMGKTILFVSHDMGMIRKICDRVFYIKKGGELIDGTPAKMVALYLKNLYYKYSENDLTKEVNVNSNHEEDVNIKDIHIHESAEFIEANRYGNMDLEIVKVYFSHKNGVITNVFRTFDDIKVNIEYKMNKKIETAVIGMSIQTEEGWEIAGNNCKENGVIVTDIQEYNYSSFVINRNPFVGGKYYMTMVLYDEDCIVPFDVRHKHYWFYIDEEKVHNGKFILDCNWNI